MLRVVPSLMLDILNKLEIVEEEADETLFWQELLVEVGIVPATRLSELMRETDEIIAMTVASIKTLRTKMNRKSKIMNHNES